MKFIDLTIPLGVGTPPWPTYVPLQVQYFKRLAPNGANGQVLTHSNHVGTHLDGEIHFYTPGKDIAELDFDFLTGDICGDYDVYSPDMIEERVEVKENDILIIHTGFHHFGWDQPYGNEIRYMIKHPGPDPRFARWCEEKKIKWIGVDCGSADHPMNTKIRDWMEPQAKEADQYFREKYGKPLAEYFTPEMYQMMHLWMFDKGIIHVECVGGDIDLLTNRRVQVGCFPWRFVDGEASICRVVAMVEDDEYAALMKKKEGMPKTRFGDCYDPEHVERLGGRGKPF
jgi:arylformamidase